MRPAVTFDPPTSPLDANGQGVPYAVYGYGAHLAEVEVDMRLDKGGQHEMAFAVDCLGCPLRAGAAGNDLTLVAQDCRCFAGK